MFAVVTLAMNSGSRKKTPTPDSEREAEHQRDRALAELDALVAVLAGPGSLDRRAPDEPARADEQRLVQDDEPADEGQLRPARAVDAASRGARWRRRSGRRDGGGRPRSRRGRASGRLRSAPGRRTSSEALREVYRPVPTAHARSSIAAIEASPLTRGRRRRPPSVALPRPQLARRRSPRRSRSRRTAGPVSTAATPGRADAHERIEHEVARARSPARAAGAATRSGFWVGWTGSLTRSWPAQIGASMKLCMSRCRPKFHVWPRSQQRRSARTSSGSRPGGAWAAGSSCARR